MNKRKLTSEEIECLLDFIKPNKKIPPETAESVVMLTKKRFRKQLVDQILYPEVIPQLKVLLEKNYLESLIDPGTSVGILCAQSIGERQTQNSVSYEAEILLRKNHKVLKTTIGEFIESEMKNGENVFEYDANNYIKTVSNIEVLTVSQEEKIEWKNVSELSKHPVNGDLIKVTTESGRTAITTLSHSHLKKEDGMIKPILGSDLVIGNRIPVIKKSPVIDYEYNNFDDIIWVLSEKGIFSRKINNVLVIQKKYVKKLENAFEENEKLSKYLYSFENDFETSTSDDSHIIWDKITNIEIIKESDYKNKYVYDFSVPGNETFALFSGIVVHNTLNTLI